MVYKYDCIWVYIRFRVSKKSGLDFRPQSAGVFLLGTPHNGTASSYKGRPGLRSLFAWSTRLEVVLDILGWTFTDMGLFVQLQKDAFFFRAEKHKFYFSAPESYDRRMERHGLDQLFVLLRE